jgi:site-specific recombinase XerD
VKDLDFMRDEIRVEHEKGKTGRVLPVAHWAMVAAKEYLEKARHRFATAGQSDLFFIGKRKPRVTVHTNDTLKELQRQTVEENPDLSELATKNLTTHGLRVTFAKLLFNGGCNLRSVNELMLHNRLSTTAYYTPLSLEELRSACRVAHPRA